MEGAMQGQALRQGMQSLGNATGYPANVAGAAQVQVEPTLLRALSALDEMNKRLGGLLSNAYEIACAVGGPYPVGGEASPEKPGAPSAMARLNDGLSNAHRQISEVEGALGAIRRALGQ
jgi:hypothetical protein